MRIENDVINQEMEYQWQKGQHLVKLNAVGHCMEPRKKVSYLFPRVVLFRVGAAGKNPDGLKKIGTNIFYF